MTSIKIYYNSKNRHRNITIYMTCFISWTKICGISTNVWCLDSFYAYILLRNFTLETYLLFGLMRWYHTYYYDITLQVSWMSNRDHQFYIQVFTKVRHETETWSFEYFNFNSLTVPYSYIFLLIQNMSTVYSFIREHDGMSI